MNRVAITVATVLVASLALSGGALAWHSDGAGQGSSRDFAVGTGMNEIGRVSFAAHGGPSPSPLDPVTGHFHAKGVFPITGEFNIDGPVTCLTVVGNEAGLFYPVRNPDPTSEPNGVFVFLQDNGNPAGGDQPDKLAFAPTFGPITEPPVCPAVPPPPPPEVTDLDRGNITIHDGS